MPLIYRTLRLGLRRFHAHQLHSFLRWAHYKAPSPPSSPSPPKPPQTPKKSQNFTLHGISWDDHYSWMSNLNDKVAMRHMDVCMELEEKYTEAVMSDTERLQSKLQTEIGSRLSFELSSPPLRFGPWLYYRRVEEGKQYPVLCRRLASLNEEMFSSKSPMAGFDSTSGKRIEQKLLDYNQEAERFGGYAYEELSEVSPDHRFIAYTMYDKDNDWFKLSVRNLNSGSLCSKPQVDRVSNIAWAKDGQALIYVVTDQNKRPYRVYCSTIGSTDDDVLLLEELDDNVQLYIRHTKDFRFVTVNRFCSAYSKVFLIDPANPLSNMALIWDCEGVAHCVVEHHQGYLYLFTDASKAGHIVDHHYLLRSPVNSTSRLRIWEEVFINDPNFIVEDVDFNHTHMVLTVREGQKLGLCSVSLPLLDGKVAVDIKEIKPHFLPLPNFVSKISSGTNYDFYSSMMRFIISSPVSLLMSGKDLVSGGNKEVSGLVRGYKQGERRMKGLSNIFYRNSCLELFISEWVTSRPIFCRTFGMPDAVVDYDLSNDKWTIIQQKNIFHERTRTLYGTTPSSTPNGMSNVKHANSMHEVNFDDNATWNDLSEFYACEQREVLSYDGTIVPLTVVYSRKSKLENQSPGLLQGHGAYGELLDKRWRGELKSLLDRGWVIAYADVRGGGGAGKKWHLDGKGIKKLNSVKDYISCARFLVEKGMVKEDKLAGWGYSAGGLLVASAVNLCPELFRAAVLKVPFLDPTNTLTHPVLPLTAVDYEEFGYPGDLDDFNAMREYSPYDNIQKGVAYPAVLVTSSFNTRFGVWEAAKWAARVRESTIYDPNRPILLNLTTDIVEENRYLQCKESAMEIAFLIKVMES